MQASRTQRRIPRPAALAVLIAVCLVASGLAAAPAGAAPTQTGQVETAQVRGHTVSVRWTRNVTVNNVYENRWVRLETTKVADRVYVPSWFPAPFGGVIAGPGYAQGGGHVLNNAFGDPNLRVTWEYVFYTSAQGPAYDQWWWTGDSRPVGAFNPTTIGQIDGADHWVFFPDNSYTGSPGSPWYNNWIVTQQSWPFHTCDEQVRWWLPWPFAGVWVQCSRLRTFQHVDRYQPVLVSSTTTTTHSVQVTCPDGAPVNVNFGQVTVGANFTVADATSGGVPQVRVTSGPLNRVIPITGCFRPLRPT